MCFPQISSLQELKKQSFFGTSQTSLQHSDLWENIISNIVVDTLLIDPWFGPKLDNLQGS